MYSISSIKEHVIRCKCLIFPFKGGIPLPVFPEMFTRKLFPSKLTTISVGYPLTFWQISGNIITLKEVSTIV